MVEECVVSVYDTLDRAQDSIKALVWRGTPSDCISLVTMSLKGKPAIVAEIGLRDDSLYDAAVSAGLGGTLGVLTGLGALVISGLGVLFFVGPLYGALIGGMAGGFIGAMSGTGIHEHQLQRYERLLHEGNTLVVVSGDPLQLASAHHALEETQPRELHTYSKSAGDEVGAKLVAG